jgi:hypothetical protein
MTLLRIGGGHKDYDAHQVQNSVTHRPSSIGVTIQLTVAREMGGKYGRYGTH